jgi:hypothetical protein
MDDDDDDGNEDNTWENHMSNLCQIPSWDDTEATSDSFVRCLA